MLLAACTPEEVPGEQDTPKEPAAPVIVSAQLKGANGEAEIVAGNPVKFTASVTVENSELQDYTLEIKNDGIVIGSASGELTGTSATIEKELTLDVNPATLEVPFFPVVTLKVTNKDEMYAEKTLTEAENVKITTIELLDALWLVDDLGAVYQMSAVAEQKGKYRTTASLEVLGTSFQIVSKVTPEGAIDASGENYGTFDTPDGGEEGLYWIGYDIFTEELSKCLNLTHTLDYTKMDTDGAYKVYWNATLVQDCRVVFLNYPEGLQLQPDRWSDVDGNTARYTGHTNEHWEIYYNPDANWLVLKEQWLTTLSLWITGENAGLPMSPYAGDFAFNWFGADQTNTNHWRSWDRATFVMKGENKWEIVLYLKANFGIKLYYGAASWGAECSWTSTTPETLVISEVTADPETGELDGNYGNAGPSFTEGLYTLKYNSGTEEVSLEKYTGPTYGVATGDRDPIAPEPEPEPDQPAPDVPAAGLYLVDAAGNVWTMASSDNTFYTTDEQTAGIGSSFTFAEKYADGAIDQTGAVYGPFDLDAAYAVYGQKPFKVSFDKAAGKVVYHEFIDGAKLANNGDGRLVRWIVTLPTNCLVEFANFDKPVAQLVNTAGFADIKATSARYIGVSENFELWYRVDQGWLDFSNNIAANKMFYIGKNCSFPQAPYTEFPCQEDLSRVTGHTLSLFKISDNIYRTNVYLADNFGCYLYRDYNWGQCVDAWTSATPDVLVPHSPTYTYGTQNVENAFTPGVYTLEYNSEANTIGITLLYADGQEPEPVGPPTALTLTDNNGASWAMSNVSGSVFRTDEGTAAIGTSFTVVGDNGVDYGTYNLDAAYGVLSQKPFKVSFDYEAKKVYYNEFIDMSKLANNGDGRLVRWVVTLPTDCLVEFANFGKPVSQLVNTAGFADITETSARYIGVSENFELWYRVDQGWLDFSNNIAANKMFYIGKNCSFPQAPYTEFPCQEDLSRVTGHTLSLFKISDNIYRTNVYLADNFGCYLYRDYNWGQCVDAWTSATPDVLVPHSPTYTYGTQNVENAFTPGVYTLEYNSEANTVGITPVNE